jgi:hypothetical protein
MTMNWDSQLTLTNSSSLKISVTIVNSAKYAAGNQSARSLPGELLQLRLRRTLVLLKDYPFSLRFE